MAARVENHIACTQQCAALQCPAQQMNGLLPDELLGRGQVDQVRSVDNGGIEVIVACRLCKRRVVHSVTGRGVPAGLDNRVRAGCGGPHVVAERDEDDRHAGRAKPPERSGVTAEPGKREFPNAEV